MLPSGATQGPPESANVRGLTARTCAHAKNVADAPRNSVLNFALRLSISKNLATLELAAFSSIFSINPLIKWKFNMFTLMS